MARGRPTRGRRLFLLLLPLLVLLLAGGGLLLYARHDPARERREAESAAGRAMESGDYDKAQVILSRLVAANPTDVRLRRSLAACLLKLDRLSRAEAVALRTEQLAPDDAATHSLLAAVASRTGRLDDALREARLAVEHPDADTTALYSLADLLLTAGQPTEALSVLTRAAARADADADIPLRLATLLRSADPESPLAARARRTLEKVLARAKSRLDEEPAEGSRLAAFVELSLLVDRPRDAVLALTAVPVERPLTRPEKLLLARAYAENGQGDLARSVLDALGPASGDADAAALARTRALVDLKEGRPDAAARAIAPALAAAPRDPDLLRLGLEASRQSLDRLGAAATPDDFRRLETAAGALLRVRPDDETGLEARAVGRLRLGRVWPALEDARHLARIAPGSPAGAWLSGLALLRAGEAASALPSLEAGRARVPPAEAAVWICRAAARSGDASRARRYLDALPRSRPAIRAAALATAGDVAGAAALAGTAPFASARLSDRVLAASALARSGAPATARALAGELATGAGPARLLRADLDLSLGDRGAAAADLLAAAAPGSPVARTALLRRAELALSGPALPGPPLEEVLSRLAALPDTAGPVRRLRARAAIAAGRTEEAAALVAAEEKEAPDLPGTRRLELALLLARRAAPGRIRDAAEAVLDLLPGDEAARKAKARAIVSLLGAGKTDDALEAGGEDLDEAVRLAPGEGEPRLLRGVLGLVRGDVATAERDAAALMADDDTAAIGRYILGVVRARQVRYPEAEKLLRAAVAGRPGAPEPLYALGNVLLARGRGDEALGIADRLSALPGARLSAGLLRVRALLSAGRPAAAVAAARKLAGDGQVFSRTLLGTVLLRTKQPVGAAKVLTDVVRDAPDRSGPRALLARARLAAGDAPGALAAAGELAALDGAGPAGLLLAAEIHRQRGETAAEAENLEEARRRYPKSAAVHRALGERRLREGRRPEARAELERAAALDRGEVPARMDLAMLARRDDDRPEEISWYEEILAAAPGNALAANNLAFLLAERSASPERAVELARRAVTLAPAKGEFHDTLAFALNAAGRPRDAAKEAERALELAKNDAWVAVRAAEIFRDAGNADRARAAVKTAKARARPDEREKVEARTEAVLRSLD